MIALELPRRTRAVLFVGGLLAPVAVALALRVVFGPAEVAEEAGARAPEVVACDPTSLEETCPEGQRCMAGACQRLRLAARCELAEECSGCLCAPGLECFRGRCSDPESLPLAPAQCRTSAVRAAVAYLQSHCAAERGEREAPLSACDAETWLRLSTRDPQFEARLADVPGAFSVHFPTGMPDPEGRWPGPEIRQALKQQLAERGEVLRGARQIFVVGRASVDGAVELNRQLAERRSRLVDALLEEVLGPEGPQRRVWALASEFPLAPEPFQGHSRGAPVAWGRPVADELAALLDRSVDLSRVPNERWQWLRRAINRVVLVVPLRCDGDEFDPAPAFQGAGSTPMEDTP